MDVDHQTKFNTSLNRHNRATFEAHRFPLVSRADYAVGWLVIVATGRIVAVCVPAKKEWKKTNIL